MTKTTLCGLSDLRNRLSIVVYYIWAACYIRDAMLFFHPKDLRLAFGGVKLSPNIPLSAWPCSANITSFATMAALSVMWFISFVLLHKQLASCSLLRFECSAIPHFWKSLFLSSAENLFCISLLSITLSRPIAFMLCQNKHVAAINQNSILVNLCTK